MSLQRRAGLKHLSKFRLSLVIVRQNVNSLSSHWECKASQITARAENCEGFDLLHNHNLSCYYDNVKSLFTPIRLNALSQLFINLSAGWFGIVFIIPGVTKLDTFDDFLWLTKNVLLGILALLVAMIVLEKGGK